jgi:hypothetical protein
MIKCLKMITLYPQKPSESAIHTAEFIANVLPKYLDKRAYTVIQGAVKETTVVLGE